MAQIVAESDRFIAQTVQRWGRTTFQAQVIDRVDPAGRQGEPIIVCDHSHRTRAGAANCAVQQLRDVEGEP